MKTCLMQKPFNLFSFQCTCWVLIWCKVLLKEISEHSGLVIVTLFAFFCFWLIDLMTMVFFFVLNLLFDYYSGLQIHLAPKMRFNLVQYHGTVGDFNYCKFTNLPISCSIKKYLNLNLLRLVSLQIIIIIMFHFIAGVAFMLLIVFYLLKLEMSKKG